MRVLRVLFFTLSAGALALQTLPAASGLENCYAVRATADARNRAISTERAENPTPSLHRPRDEESRRKIGGPHFGPLHPQRMRSLSLGLPSLAIIPVSRLDKERGAQKTRGRHPKPTPPGSKLVFDVLHEPLRAGVFELRLRDVPAPIFVDLREVDDERCGG